ncbi:MAG: tRNA pseudouridine(38-40) synthase TruA [Planctomycetes bacterium]|nr:tRNA pseudouridine(38-40) synthase TruA [Planctomycetota bacterium]
MAGRKTSRSASGVRRPASIIPSRRFRATVSYVGTRYGGWQRQKNAPSVQQAVEEAIGRVVGTAVPVEAASRTDAGVHARGQVISFDAATPLPADRLAEAVNAHLPPEVAVREAREAPSGFRARVDARWKRYEYRIATGRTVSPLDAPFVWRRPGRLDVAAMRDVAGCLVGEHDFLGFCDTPPERGTTIRRLLEIRVLEQPDDTVSLVFVGVSFLHKMVRRLTGALARVGDGAIDRHALRGALSPQGGEPCRWTAPAEGLCLQEVGYSPYRDEA